MADPLPMPARARRLLWITALGLSLLAGCGGGDATDAASPQAAVDAAAPLGNGMVVFGQDDAPEVVAALAAVPVEPSYHLAPVLPTPPSGIDAGGTSASALLGPTLTELPRAQRLVQTSRLGLDQIGAEPSASGSQPSLMAAPAAVAPKVSATYTPAQVRAAYGLPPVPSNLAGITATQAAQLGAGQTIYIVDAFHNPMAAGELAAFSQLFGLPACATRTLPAGSRLPLPAASSTACEFYQVYASSAGAITNTAPAYNATWAVEIAMDIQWAHAIAPLARIVLIEAADASMGAISGAIQLTNQMGPGVVSMSFGAPEGSYANSMDSLFQSPGMSYFAATGDGGTGVSWPSVSRSVVAVGGTSLNYTGTGPRTETAWSLTGGGASAFVPVPTYQSATLATTATQNYRVVADVAMNADPSTGQFVAVVPNATTCSFCQISWITAGGTSLSTPQWAALAAVGNALRVQSGKALLGDFHSALYTQLAGSTTSYAANFYDVSQGSNGACIFCLSRKGYDGPTGLGSPFGLTTVNALAGVSASTAPPVVVGAAVKGAYGQALSFTASVSAANAYTVTLSGAPAGMTATAAGVVSWPNPIAGTFNVTVIAKDTRTGLTGRGVYAVTITPPPPPIVSSGSIPATVGQALSFMVGAGDMYQCTLSLSGAPAGMTIRASGYNGAIVSWPKPLAGIYKFSVVALDTRTKLSSRGQYAVAVSPVGAPQVAGGNIGAAPGQALTFNVGVSSANPATLGLSGAPAGMSIASSGAVSWPNPVAGTYAVVVQAKDSKTGLVGSGVVTVVVDKASGPQVMTSLMTGVAGKPFAGTISITDSGASLLGVGFGGAPSGVSFTPQGGFNTSAVNWSNPVAGKYTIQVSATDGAGKTGSALIPLVISAK